MLKELAEEILKNLTDVKLERVTKEIIWDESYGVAHFYIDTRAVGKNLRNLAAAISKKLLTDNPEKITFYRLPVWLDEDFFQTLVTNKIIISVRELCGISHFHAAYRTDKQSVYKIEQPYIPEK